MVKANELRLGNNVIYNGEVVTINTIDDQESGFNEFLNTSGRARKLNYEDAEPIPLTPEVLERCGFEFNGADYWYINTFPVVWDGEKFELIGQNNLTDDAAKVHIQYLHQLQNIYFILTGKELIYTSY